MLRMIFNHGEEFIKTGDYAAALEKFEKCYEYSREMLGEHDRMTLCARGSAGQMLSHLGRLPEALERLESVLVIDREVLRKANQI
jgi:hypothetical protein